jgi:hypothetical protein
MDESLDTVDVVGASVYRDVGALLESAISSPAEARNGVCH